MSEWIKAFVLRVSRLPADPHEPDGSAGSTQVFRAGRNFLRWSMMIWAFAQAGILVSAIAFGIAIETLMFRFPTWAQTGVRLVEWIAVAMLAAVLIFTWYQLRLNYELRWYIVTDRSLRIRSGIFTVQELTMTFANIQEIRVTSTPLQVFLGLADVEVHSAGGGSGGVGIRGGHVGRFQGVDNADSIRDLVMERLRIYRDSGLGESHDAPHPGRLDLRAAANSVLAEARALREILQRA
jgi:uncharacterized membrane protein YdbT with pleckstrin-like domain